MLEDFCSFLFAVAERGRIKTVVDGKNFPFKEYDRGYATEESVSFNFSGDIADGAIKTAVINWCAKHDLSFTKKADGIFFINGGQLQLVITRFQSEIFISLTKFPSFSWQEATQREEALTTA